MSENGDSTNTDLMKNVVIISKNIKTLTERIKNIDEKINQPKSNNVFKNEDDKEKMDKIFEKKSIGRPKGDHQTKRQQYYDMIVSNKIKQPKEQTLEYYKITKDGDEYTLMD